MTSFIVQRLQIGVDSVEFKRLRPAYQHAIAVAREAEHRSEALAIQIQQRVDTVYPPLVELLAQCAPDLECPF